MIIAQITEEMPMHLMQPSDSSRLDRYRIASKSPTATWHAPLRCRIRLQAWATILLLAGVSVTGCSSLTKGKLSENDLSMMPQRNTVGGQENWNQSEASDQYYAERRDTSIKMKDLAPDRLPRTIKNLAGYGPEKQVAQTALDKGREQYAAAVALRRDNPQSEEAAKAFLAPIDQLKIAADRWPDSSIEEDALYLLGECCFFADYYDDANDYFEKLVEIYPSTRYLDRVQSYRFNIARYWLQVAEKQSSLVVPVNFTDERKPLKDIAGEGRRVLDRIRLDDPTGKLSDDATFMLGKAFYAKERYFEAAETFADLRNNYPGSEHQFNAHLMEFESRLAMYDGKHYDGRALKQAEEVLRILLKRFPQQSENIRDELTKEAGEVRHMLADRDMQMAQYYIKRSYNQSARIYLHRLIQDYPETDVAREATELLAEIKDQPDEPEQVAKWLVDVFPEPQSTRPLIRSGALK